jgi:hypothetical protein
MLELVIFLGIFGFIVLAGMGVFIWLLNTLVSALKKEDGNLFE